MRATPTADANRLRPTVARYGLAVALSLVMTSIRLALDPLLGEHAPLIVLVPAFTFAAWWGGTGPGLLATALCAVAGAYLFVAPAYEMGIPAPPDQIRVAIFLVEGVMISWLLGSRRKVVHAAQAAADQVARSEARFRDVLDASPALVFVKDLEGRLTFVNRALAEQLGLPPDQLLGKTSYDVFPPELAEAHARNDREALESSAPLEREEVAIIDGRERIYLSVKFPLCNGGGRPYAVCGLATEITERRAAEDALRRSEAALRAFFENTAVGLVQADVETRRLVQVNEAYARITGYSRQELLGMTVADLTHPEDYAAEETQLQQLLRGDVRAYNTSKRYVRKDGRTIWVTTSVTVIREGGEPRRTAAVVQDVTQRKAAEAAIAAMTTSLEQRVAERTAELEAFSYTVSHDLRAPLRAMEGFASALLEDYGDALGDAGRHYASRIIAAAGKMEALIRDLLEYSRLSRAVWTPRTVDPVVALQDAMSALSADIERSGAVVRVPERIGPVLAHRNTLTVVLQNLVSNAIKFVAPGMTPDVRIDAHRRGDYVRIAVTDNGIGIAPEHQERIFEVFERLHGEEQYPGTGIGLAMVRRAVQRMGGKVGVASSVGQGSTFWVELPAADRSDDGPQYPPR